MDRDCGDPAAMSSKLAHLANVVHHRQILPTSNGQPDIVAERSVECKYATPAGN